MKVRLNQGVEYCKLVALNIPYWYLTSQYSANVHFPDNLFRQGPVVSGRSSSVLEIIFSKTAQLGVYCPLRSRVCISTWTMIDYR